MWSTEYQDGVILAVYVLITLALTDRAQLNNKTVAIHKYKSTIVYYSRSYSRIQGQRKRDVQHPCHCELLIASLGTSFCSRNHSLAKMQLHNLYRSLIAKRGACAISSLRSFARMPLSTPFVKHAECHFLFLSYSVE